MAVESSVYQALMHTMTTSTDTEVAIPSHGRHPNYTFLMKGPSTTTTATRTTLVRNAPRGELPPSIAEKPYLYWYTGRKWPNSLYHRPLCEAATCVIEGSDGGQDRLQCARYEVVGCPVVIERYQLSRSDTFLCRMFCSKSNPAETRVGGAVAHLAGTSAQLIHDLMCNSVAPMLLPEMGHREASWTTYTSAIDNECNSESSSSTSNSICAMGQTGMGQPSMGRSSTGSSCGLSTTATPLTPSRLSGESTSRGLSPEIAHIEPLSAITSLTSSSGKSATLLQFHHDSVADLIARDTLLQHLHNDPSGYRRSSSQVVMLGWEFWRTSGHDLKNLDHRAVIASVHEIMSSNGCSRTAFHRAAALLNLYLVQIASLASKQQQQQHHQGGSRMPLLHPRRLPSSATIRGAIACTISVASKVSDIFPPALDRLLLSLGKEVLDLAKSFESLEMEFLTLLNFYLHPVTVEEVSDTVLELWFAHTPKPTELNNAARDVVQLTRYLVDLVVRSMTHTTLPPCYMGWCVVQYAVSCVRAQRSMHHHHTTAGSLVDPFDPYDGRTIDMLVASLTHNDTKTHCTDLVRRCHIVARSRPVDFLERLYAKQRVGNHTFQGISLNAFPPVLPHGAVEATYLEALRQAS